jgi:hypothetical protein
VQALSEIARPARAYGHGRGTLRPPDDEPLAERERREREAQVVLVDPPPEHVDARTKALSPGEHLRRTTLANDLRGGRDP